MSSIERKIDMIKHLPIRPILSEPYSIMTEKLLDPTVSTMLIQAFCGLGKSRLMYNIIFDYLSDLTVFVFPYINLLKQFNSDYIHNCGLNSNNDFSILSICSIDESQALISATTDKNKIKRALNSKRRKIILVTYQSLETLYDCLIVRKKKIDLCIFDEAHHSVSPIYKRLIYIDTQYEKALFFTATPRNSNGIIMHDGTTDSHCGERIANATYIDGLNSDALNEFQIIGNITNNVQEEMKLKIVRIYEIMIRNILSTENNRVLTFHTYANSKQSEELECELEFDCDSQEDDETKEETILQESKGEITSEYEYNFKTNVQDFVNDELFKETFNRMINNEFPSLKNKYKKITFKPMTSNTPISERDKILNALDKTKENEIYIISSCKTIGEGVDTKNANHIVFVDSKSSYIDIIQNIGRGVRKTERTMRPTTITIPSFIDYERYRNTDSDTQEKRDQIVREGIYKYGDFSGIMNVLSAIQQEDEEYYKMCLIYPNKHFKSEIERNLKAKGKTMVNKQNIETIVGIQREEKESDEQYLERVAEEKQGRIELHTNDMNNEGENNIVYFGTEDHPIIHSIYKDDNQDTNNYYEITDDDIDEKQTKSKPCKRRNLCLKIKHNDDFKMLWSIENEDSIDKGISSCVLNCNISGSYLIDKWKSTLIQSKKFISEYGRLPSNKTDKDNEKYKKIGTWVEHQKTNYSSIVNERRNSMKNPEIAKLWEEFRIENERLFKTDFELYLDNLNETKKFISEYGRLPSSDTDKDNEKYKKLGKWIQHQKANYSSIVNERKYSMKNPEIAKLWEEFIIENERLFKTDFELYLDNLNETKQFISEYGRLPSPATDKDNEKYKKLGKWVEHQKTNYSPIVNERIKSMKNPEIVKLWEEFMSENEELFKTYAKYKPVQDSKQEETKSEIKLNQTETIDKSSTCEQITIRGSRCKNQIKNTTSCGKKLCTIHYNKSKNESKNESKEKTVKPSPKSTMKKIKTESKQTDNESKSSRQKSEYEKISNRMSVQKSTTTNELFASDNDQWEKYHSYRDFSFQGYPQDDIPVNKIINHLNEKSKYKLKILDLGCGRNLIKDKFKSNPKFNIIGYDHISYNGSIAVDISKLPDEDESIDICIFSQSLMGSNWREYLIDAQRVLKYNGEMIISESIDRIDDIKAVLNEIGMTIIMENRVQNGDMFGRWFYIYAIRR